MAAPATAQADALAGESRVMAVIRRIEQSLRYSSYSHATRVNEKTGSYEFDCSGFTAWVLRRSAPRAYAALLQWSPSKRPVARDFYFWAASGKPNGKGRAWINVGRVQDAQPGDVIAWIRPAEVRSPHTGHVAFIVEPPQLLEGSSDAYLVRIADASSYQHEADSRAETGDTGFGYGTILVMADPESGAPVAYGWFGRRSAWILSTKMAIGRALR